MLTTHPRTTSERDRNKPPGQNIQVGIAACIVTESPNVQVSQSGKPFSFFRANGLGARFILSHRLSKLFGEWLSPVSTCGGDDDECSIVLWLAALAHRIDGGGCGGG
jgi:hypothetical protein